MEKINLTWEFDKASNVFSDMIKKGYTIKQIAQIYDTYTYDVIYFLLRNEQNDIDILNAIKKHYESYEINGKKFLVISDTHTGRLKYNEDKDYQKQWLLNEGGTYNAYNYAFKNNIKTIVHAGDLLEGKSNSNTPSLEIPDQFKYINKFYNAIPNIKTYLLFGNHDFNLQYYNSVNLKKHLQDIKQLEIIGVNYSYVNFNNNFLKISHDCSASEGYTNIQLTYSFELSGHSHIFAMFDEERKIKVPTLSSVNLEPTYIGFLEVTEEENEYVFKFLGDNLSLKGEKVLSKNINNSYN